MLLSLDKLQKSEVLFDFEENAEFFPALAEIEEAGECDFQDSVRGRIRAFLAGEFVEVEGHLETRIKLACSRCLTGIEQPLAVDFAVTFSSNPPEVEQEEGEIELSAEELGLIPFTGEEVDLTEAVQEQVVLNIPLRPLCSQKCRGLCPQCGHDLNQGECGCETPVLSSKFAALKDFKVEKKD